MWKKALVIAAVFAILATLTAVQVFAAPGPKDGVTICHKPGTPAEKTMTVPEPALGGHLGHGDTEGPCGQPY
ncbi:MAG TPA: hypothetical protein VNL15_02795 [Dehalococcoidia bacterium]|nr:hypothetical protein [Dehalococcoidia bacterium]